MIPNTLPGWLLKRACEVRAHRALVVLSPDDEHGQCAYLLDCADGTLELHIAEDGHAGVEAATLKVTRRQLTGMISQLMGVLSGRREWAHLPKMKGPDDVPRAEGVG